MSQQTMTFTLYNINSNSSLCQVKHCKFLFTKAKYVQFDKRMLNEH